MRLDITLSLLILIVVRYILKMFGTEIAVKENALFIPEQTGPLARLRMQRTCTRTEKQYNVRSFDQEHCCCSSVLSYTVTTKLV